MPRHPLVPARSSPALAAPVLLAVLAALLAPLPAVADTPLEARASFRRASDFFATGATLAQDTDGDDNVDQLLPEASVLVEALDLAPDAFLQQAFVYWGGTITEDGNCSGTNSTIDSQVQLRAPGAAQAEVSADACSCSGADNQSRDVQACRADVTALATAGMLGTWTLGGFEARIDDGDIDTASFALVLIYGAPGLPPRQLTLYDGLRTMRYDEVTFALEDLDVDNPPAGSLTWYVLEGDIGGSSGEAVSVRGAPGGSSLLLTDEVNPAQGPMNRTINTTVPPQTGVVGVDIDAFDISAALAPGDTSVQVTYEADSDKWWLVFNIVGVRLFFSDFSESGLTWTLSDDVDGDGEPDPGDGIRVGAELVNSGEGNAVVTLESSLPPEAASWELLGFDSGTDVSGPAVLRIEDLLVPAGGSARVDWTLRLAEVPAGSTVLLTATWASEGATGELSAPPLVVGEGGGTAPLGDDDDEGGGGSSRSQGCGCNGSGGGSRGGLILALLLLRARRGRVR